MTTSGRMRITPWGAGIALGIIVECVLAIMALRWLVEWVFADALRLMVALGVVVAAPVVGLFVIGITGLLAALIAR